MHVPNLSRAIADYIIIETLAAQPSLSRSKIEASLSIQALGLDSAAKRRVQEQIIRTVESIGFSTRFSIDAFSQARTVGDLTDLLLAATGGWPTEAN
jgi:acyl carrier protein